MPLILAGADLLVLYHPGSVAALRRNVERLCRVEVPPDGAGGQR